MKGFDSGRFEAQLSSALSALRVLLGRVLFLGRLFFFLLFFCFVVSLLLLASATSALLEMNPGILCI